VPPCLEAKPSSIDFGEIEHPLNGFQRVELFNNSSLPILVHALPRNGPFSISPLDGADLPLSPGAHRTVEVQFSNTDALLHNGTIDLTGGPDCDTSISLRALGSGTVSVEPSPLDFGFLAPGQSKTLEVRITNTRRTAVPLISLELQESSSVGTAFIANPPSLPFELPPMSSSSILITATPPTDLTFDAQLVVATMFGVARGDLRVTGGGPIAQLVPNEIDIPLANFEPSVLGESAFVERRVVLRNVSTLGRSSLARLQVVAPILDLELADGGIDDEVTVVLPPEVLLGLGLDLGQELEFFVRVAPKSIGQRSHRVIFFTNDPLQAEQELLMTVNAVSLGRCSMRVEPRDELQLSPTPDGRSRGTISFINEGTNRCVVDDPGFTIMTSPEFSILDPVSQFVVEPGTTRTLTIEGPRSAMNVDGTLSFHVLNPDREREFIVLHAPP
jgi:hypothetical protein